MRHATLCFVPALVMATLPLTVRAQDDELAMRTAAGAPFTKVVIDIVPEACGRLGCEVVISGVGAAGKRSDITFTEILKNANLGTKAEMFGSNDAGGMPHIVLEQGLVNGGNTFNLFAYKPALRRYSFVKKVAGYAGGKIAVRPAAPQPPPSQASPAQALWNGTFTFPPDSVSRCVLDAERVTRKTELSAAEDWKGLIAAYVTDGCGSDLAYYEIGRSFYKLRMPEVAAVYLRRAIAIASDKTAPKALVCKRNWCGMDIKTYATAALGRAEKIMSGAYVYNDPAPQATPTPAAVEPIVVNSGVWSLGRARFLIEPRGGCPPEVSLGTKSYCFNQAMDWLRRHPDKQSVDVVAMQDSWRPGSFVPHNNGIGWNIYKVAKAGDGFTASKQRHYATKVQVPQGCIYAGVGDQAWYVTIARRGKVAVEAANYTCHNPWAGQPIYTGYLNTSDTDVGPGEIQITNGPVQARASGQPSIVQPSRQPAQSSEWGADYGGPPQRDITGSSLQIYGEPNFGTPAKPKAKK